MGFRVRQIIDNKKDYLDLLLLGDEQESAIDNYLERGEMFVLEEDGLKAICVVMDEGSHVCELKNIAVIPNFRRKGYGKKLINYLVKRYSENFHQMIVGTGDVPITIKFYQKCNFSYSHRIENFFLDNYDHPIIEDGIILKDMIYLKRKL